VVSHISAGGFFGGVPVLKGFKWEGDDVFEIWKPPIPTRFWNAHSGFSIDSSISYLFN